MWEGENDNFGIIMKAGNGKFKQIGLTESQRHIFIALLSTLSSDGTPLVVMKDEFDLVHAARTQVLIDGLHAVINFSEESGFVDTGQLACETLDIYENM